MLLLNDIFLFCCGAVFASFLNLCVYRIENDLDIRDMFTGRSFCDNCRKGLHWYELIPIFSFVFLKGKCSKCDYEIPYTNFLSEVILASSFFFFAFFNIPAIYFLFLLILYFWAVYDFNYQNIPKKITDFILLLSFFYWIFTLIFDYSLDSIYPVLIALSMGLIIYLASFKKTIFGFGDVIVLLILSFWIQTPIFSLTVFYALIFGGVFSVFLIIKDRKYFKKYIAFLPFLFFGFVFAVLSYYGEFGLFDYMNFMW